MAGVAAPLIITGIIIWIYKIKTATPSIQPFSQESTSIFDVDPDGNGGENGLLPNNGQNISTPPIETDIRFVTTSQKEVKIHIKSNMTVSEMIKSYFQEVNKPDLLGNPDVRFLFKAKILFHDSKEPLSNYIKKKDVPYTIVVDDLNDNI